MDDKNDLENLHCKRLCFDERDCPRILTEPQAESCLLKSIENQIGKMTVTDDRRFCRESPRFTEVTWKSPGHWSVDTAIDAEFESITGTSPKSVPKAHHDSPSPGSPDPTNRLMSRTKRLSLNEIANTPLKDQRYRPRTSGSARDRQLSSAGSQRSVDQATPSSPLAGRPDCLEEEPMTSEL